MPRMIGFRISPREREILDVLNRLGEATNSEILARMPSPPSYSAVRATLRVMVQKGLIKDKEDGKRYVYSPAAPRQDTLKSELSQLVDTFFGGRVDNLVKTLLSSDDSNLSNDDLDELSALIERAKEHGK